jgi:single-strand DNA-binding protein
MSINKATIIGALGKDPDIRPTQNGSRVASFSVATSESWKDKVTGEKKEQTEWHRIVVFNTYIVNAVESLLVKGSKVYIEGKIKSRKWTGDDGKENVTTEIVLGQYDGTLEFLGGNKREAQQDAAAQQKPNTGGHYGSDGKFVNDLDDDSPF